MKPRHAAALALVGDPNVSRKRIACPECGKKFLKRLGSESITWARSERTKRVVRIFTAECTEHGKFWDANDPGNHLTMLEADAQHDQGQHFPSDEIGRASC